MSVQANGVQAEAYKAGPSSVTAQVQSVQEFPAGRSAGFALLGVTERGAVLPAYGTRECDRFLRLLYRSNFNTLMQGAVSGMAKKVASTPYRIDGPAVDVAYFQELLQNAHFGEGWSNLIPRTLENYFTQNLGGLWEIIGYGAPERPLIGRPTGIASLDPARCWLSGNPEWPVVYFSSIQGKIYRLHRTRVIRFVDMPSGEETLYGYGMCAQYRAAAISDRQLKMGKYISAALDDTPKPGIMLVTGTTQQRTEEALLQYQRKQQADALDEFGKTLWLHSLDLSNPLKLEAINFATPPDRFDFSQYTNLDVNMLALALGVDKQELWELTGGTLGSGQQSVILAQKSRGKTLGDLLARIERAVNLYILPEACRFTFEYPDDEGDTVRAQLDTAYMTIAQHMATLPGVFTPDQIRQFLMDNSKSFRKALAESATTVTAVDVDRGITVRPLAASVEPQAKALAELAYKAGFDPNQPRDEQGRWTETGATAPSGPAAWFSGGHQNVNWREIDTDKFRRQLDEEYASGQLSIYRYQSLMATLRREVDRRAQLAARERIERERQAFLENYLERTRPERERREAQERAAREARERALADIGFQPDDFKRAAGFDALPAELNARASVEPIFNEDGSLKVVEVFIQGEGVDIQRTFYYQGNEPDYVSNDRFFLDPSLTGGGIGTKLLKSQVDQASTMGFKYIRTLAGKSESMNGYYTWPRLGYDGLVVYSRPIPISAKLPVKERQLEGGAIRYEYRLSDIMHSEEGRAWWKVHGQQMTMQFDLAENSRSRKILDAYYAARFGNKAAKAFEKGIETEPPLTEEDEALLDRIWDNIDFSDTQDGIDYEALYWSQAVHTKAYAATAEQFVADLMRLIRGGRDEMARRRFGIVMRAQLRRYGQQAFQDGYTEAGAEGQLAEDELVQVQTWLSNQSAYVTQFADQIYQVGRSDAEIAAHAQQWANKSLQTAYAEGQMAGGRKLISQRPGGF